MSLFKLRTWEAPKRDRHGSLRDFTCFSKLNCFDKVEKHIHSRMRYSECIIRDVDGVGSQD